MQFFIRRPVFAIVLSIVTVLMGALALWTLPVAQYPEIAPPTILVTASYPGASAQDVSSQVAIPLELQINGVENMLYMESKSTNDGQLKLTITFNLGTDLDMAQVLVQNRVSLAEPKVPEAVRRLGVSVKKQSPSIVMCVNLISPGGRYDQLYMSNFAANQVKDNLAALDGVGDVTFLGEREYSMRVWLDPPRVAQRDLTAGDIVKAIREQNVQIPAGQLGQPPAPKGQSFQYPIVTAGRLASEQDFANIIINTGADGQITRLSDVARVELSARNYDVSSTLSGAPTVTLAVYQRPGSNALETAKAVRNKMQELKDRFPPDIKYVIEYDTTEFVKTSIETVVHTLLEAIVLVFIVVLVFLQSWRASLIPLVAVPVAIVGTFAALALFGFSLNNLTLLGLVLAIGIVVDDAIVVVEAVEHHMAHGMSPVDATSQAMHEVSGPVIAVALVLSAVFVPAAFIPGITGQFFKQFALTIAVSTVLSAFNSLTLSPALCPLLLRPKGESRDLLTRLLDGTLGWFFRGFNWAFDRTTSVYTRLVGVLISGSVLVLMLYGGLLALTVLGFMRVPTGFIPQQDKGYLIVGLQLPDAASLERTQQVVAALDAKILKTHGVRSTIGVQGMSILTNSNGSNLGSIYVILEPFEERGHGPSADEVASEVRRLAREVEEAQVYVFGAPPVDGLGSAAGFKMQVQAYRDLKPKALADAADELCAAANATPGLLGVSSAFQANTPQLFLKVNGAKTKAMGVSLEAVNEALQVYMGSMYVNDVTLFDRNYQVNVQADSRFRINEADLKQIKVRNNRGEMAPLGTLVDVTKIGGPATLTRYNRYPAATVTGLPGPGVSSGQAIAKMKSLAEADLPPGVTYEWTELTLLQIMAGNTAVFVFALAVVLVFLVLAAQYESWTLPLAVILVVPMCLLCSLAGVMISRGDMNIFTQIGFIVLVGLASKNAILIVEFAKSEQEKGKSTLEATTEACRLRFRPILMTSFAFILGVVPLVLAHGAGAEMRKALGVAVFSGMLGVTLFGVFLTPVFYYVVQWLFSKHKAT